MFKYRTQKEVEELLEKLPEYSGEVDSDENDFSDVEKHLVDPDKMTREQKKARQEDQIMEEDNGVKDPENTEYPEHIKEKDAKIVHGLWDFIGYHPEGCKQRPKCYTTKMVF